LKQVDLLMAEDTKRSGVLNLIRANIERYGHHIYVVSGGTTPRFAYTIGASESIGTELILAGAILYMKDDLVNIINELVSQMKELPGRKISEVAGLGSFTFRDVDSSWAGELMLGAADYYQRRHVPALQIVPDKTHWTIDVPDLSVPWSATKEPVWQWLREPWIYPVPENSTATTNLAALRRGRVTEAARWEESEWEIFAGAGPDIPKDEIRVVSIGTLVAADASLLPVLALPVGGGLWRDADSDWHPWKAKRPTTEAQGSA